MKTLCVLASLAALIAVPTPGRAAAPLTLVAAENFYGDVARQIGGTDVQVTSILDNPNQDPHLFEVSPSVAREISAARIVVYSGIDYDPWMEKLLNAARSSHRKVIVVAPLGGRKSGDNPHVWYDVQTMLSYAAVLTDTLGAEDPADAAAFRRRLARFRASIAPVEARIAALRHRLTGTPVTATEPIFGYMFEALGMRNEDRSFQLSIMNNTEPSASDVAALETDLRTHKVKLLIYNSQVSDPTTLRMTKIAQAAQVPVVGATETEPPGQTYQAWMTGELDAVARALPP